MFTVLIIVFAVNNRHDVEVVLWPLPESMNLMLRLFFVVLVPAAVAFLCGWFVGWWNAGRYRSLARRQSERIDRLTAEVKRLRSRQSQVDEEAVREAEKARSEAAGKAAGEAALLDVPRGTPAIASNTAGTASPAGSAAGSTARSAEVH